MKLQEQIRFKVFEQLILKEEKKPNFHKILRGLLLTIDNKYDWRRGSIDVEWYNIKDIPNFEDKCRCHYKPEDYFSGEFKEGKGDLIDFENREVLELTPPKLRIYAGGDWQPMHVITIMMKDDGELYIDSCERADDKKMGKSKIKQKDFIKKLMDAPF